MAPDPATSGPRPEQRRFIRHTVGVPIEVRTVAAERRRASTRDVSHGGISFLVDDDIPVGTIIEIRIPDVRPPFQARARVVWSTRESSGYCLGVAFMEADDAFRARMVEQVSSIERYRRQVRETEGRVLSAEEAAAEWITRFAHGFPE